MDNLVFNRKMTKNWTLYDNSTGTTSISYIWPHLFFKGEFICRVFPPANTNKGHSPHSCRAQHTPGCDTHSLHRNQPWDSLLVLLIFYPTMMLSAPALCQLHGNHWIYKFPSLPSASFGADLALLVHLLLFPKAISISKGLIHAASQGHSHFTDPLIYSHYSNNQKPG